MAVQKVYDNGYVSYENAKLYAPFLLLYAQRTITTIQAVGAVCVMWFNYVLIHFWKLQLLYLCHGM